MGDAVASVEEPGGAPLGDAPSGARNEKRAQAELCSLAQDEGVIDSLLDIPLPWSIRRALACTCKAYKEKMIQYWKRDELILCPHDCTSLNVRFLINRLLKILNPQVKLTFCDNNEGKVTEEEKGEAVVLRDWMADHEFYKDPGQKFLDRLDWMGRHEGPSPPMPAKIVPDMGENIGHTRAFFLGRAWACLINGRIRMKIGEDHHQFNSPPSLRDINYEQDMARCRQLTPTQQTFLSGAYLKVAKNGIRSLCGKPKKRNPADLKRMGLHMLDDAGAQALAALTGDASRNTKVYGAPWVFDLENTFNKISRGLFTPLVGGLVYTAHVTTLNLSHNLMTDPERVQLIAALASNRFPSLSSLNLNNVRLSDENMEALSPCFGNTLKNLHALQLADNEFHGDGLTSFMRHAGSMKGLVTLNMDRSHITGQDIVRFANWLRHCCAWSTIKNVTMSPIPQAPATPQDAALLMKAIKLLKERADFDVMCEKYNQRLGYELAGAIPDLDR